MSLSLRIIFEAKEKKNWDWQKKVDKTQKKAKKKTNIEKKTKKNLEKKQKPIDCVTGNKQEFFLYNLYLFLWIIVKQLDRKT